MGANLIDKIKHDNRIGSDSNKYLIALLNHVLHGLELPDTYDEYTYTRIKNDKDNFDDWIVGLVGFNTFGSKWFGGFPRDKTGKRDIIKEGINNIRRQAPTLDGIKFYHKDYSNINPNSIKDYVIVCDPPYRSTTKYKDGIDYNHFYNWCIDLSKNNKVFVFEYDMPKPFKCVWEMDYTNGNLGNQKKRRSVEKLWTI